MSQRRESRSLRTHTPPTCVEVLLVTFAGNGIGVPNQPPEIWT